MKAYLGLDLGAVSTNLAVVGASPTELVVLHHSYARTEGDPIRSVGRALAEARARLPEVAIAGCGSTGSGRSLAAALMGADLARNEVTAHATAALHFYPDVRTIIEIGGQDSKLIVVRDGAVTDFAMNTVCAAGTGSLLDHQAARMGIAIEDLASLALSATESVRVSGRCAVFAETDIVDKQQRGARREALLRGLCDALVRNFLSGVARGKPLEPPVVFQGGVASNRAVVEAFERELGVKIQVPAYSGVMGAIGIAMLVRGEMEPGAPSKFRGFEVRGSELSIGSFECGECPDCCEIVEILDRSGPVTRWGGRCGKWDAAP
jgi:predicted CoA-substrate-specific enzyme activase